MNLNRNPIILKVDNVAITIPFQTKQIREKNARKWKEIEEGKEGSLSKEFGRSLGDFNLVSNPKPWPILDQSQGGSNSLKEYNTICFLILFNFIVNVYTRVLEKHIYCIRHENWYIAWFMNLVSIFIYEWDTLKFQ